MKTRLPKARPGYRIVEVPDGSLTKEQLALADAEEQEKLMEQVAGSLSAHLHGASMQMRFNAALEFTDYFPGNNKVPEGGAWIMVKTPPPTEYTVPPMSMWFAEPWTMDSGAAPCHRVKILTPRGELGVFPREYSIVDVTRYLEFIGKEGMSIHFFGSTSGVPEDKLFYIRSRGISKADAITMLLGEVKAHGVCWLQSDKTITDHFGMQWPPDERNACVPTKD